MSRPIAIPPSQETIHDRRASILHKLCETDKGFSSIPVKSIREATLLGMLSMYDTLFFGGYLSSSYSSLTVTLSSRLISAAGKFVYARSKTRRLKRAEIRMSSDFLTRLDRGPFTLNGLTVSTPQEAFLLVFEHELCHALETCIYGSTGHGERFMQLANRYFGHTSTTHQLPTRKSEAAQSGIKIGARCRFSYQDRILHGQITYVGKTATVMVQSATGEYKDTQGRRYTKYRVPISQLTIL